MHKSIGAFFVFFCLLSCQSGGEKDKIAQLVAKWENKEIIFPQDAPFFSEGKSINYMIRSDINYRIVTYVDSIGCTSCKLQLYKWNEIMKKTDSLTNNKVEYLFYFHPQNEKELAYILYRDNFIYPVCIDKHNEFYRLNQVPHNIDFQTFLLDKNNRVLAIGNPIHNPKIKKLYLNIIQGKIESSIKRNDFETKVEIPIKSLSLDNFNWKEKKHMTFVLKNIGSHPLVIQDISTPCGCIKADYIKKPIFPGDSAALNITYQAEHKEYFDRTIKVYCNVENSPLFFRITGNAK